MYLLIFEDGEMKTTQDITGDEINAADSGMLEIVDISEPFNPTRYRDGQWVYVQDVAD